jgi:Di-haem cytochrome c peroxidase
MTTPRRRSRAGWAVCMAVLLALPAISIRHAASFPVYGDQTVLPAGTELNQDALNVPREQFRTEAVEGIRSYLVKLGDIAFNSPTTLGGVARQAGISCSSCHINGTANPKFFIPGLSKHPGTFDTTGPLFNPEADNSFLDPVRIPSLRGARYLAPYGNDGRTASLRDFVRNVIVSEFAGPEPSPAILDAMVAYIQDIDFLSNRRLGPAGRLLTTDEAELRGQALFSKPFPHEPSLSCASCHLPSGAFVDHLQHDVGSGGLFKTPTLLNANFNAPYFHDGRFSSYDQVVTYFDRVFDLGLSAQDQHDLVAYLNAIGDGERPYVINRIGVQLQEISDFVSVLDTAIPARDVDVISLTVNVVDNELRELIEQFPDHRDSTIAGGQAERRRARAALKAMVLNLSRIELAASAGNFDEAAAELHDYRYVTSTGVGAALRAAEPWSLFNPKSHDAHYDALRQMQMLQTASKPSH